MGEDATLTSRLRVLIAKTFRAEKLYSSMRNAQASGAPNTAQLAELANDVRAREWQRSYHELRTALNSIVGVSSSKQLGDEINLLRERFLLRLRESTSDVDRSMIALADTLQRQEFAHALKLVAELVRLKARAQASKAIADELTGVLQSSGRELELGAEIVERSSRALHAGAESVGAGEEPRKAVERSKVVRLHRRAG